MNMFRKRGFRQSMENSWAAGKSAIRTDFSFDAKVLGDAMEAYSKSRGEGSVETGRRRRRAAGLARLLKWASFPAVATVLLLLLNPFGESGVAWGEVMGRVEKAPTLLVHASTFMKQETAKNKGALISEIRVYISRVYGARFDILVFGKENGRLYINPDNKFGTAVNFITGKIDHYVDPDPGNGPFLKDPKREVREFLSRPYKKIGKSTIDGKKVEGIEARIDDRVPAAGNKKGEIKAERLWVEINTGLPLRKESTRKFFGNMDMVSVSDYQWNVPLDPSLFQIPEAPPAPGKK
jgi:hypothetical protein